MNSYDEHVSNLSEPERVDAAVFRPDDEASPELCDFILSLAVAYNDLRDLLLAWMLIGDLFTDDNKPSARAGQAGGLAAHLFRSVAGVIHEVLVLIDGNTVARADPAFARIVKKIHPEARKAWRALASIQKGSKSADPLARYVYWARNKVAFHYDPAAIRHGFELAFRDPAVNTPWVSRGNSMAAARFYFADAAVDAYMRDSARTDAPTITQLLEGRSEVISQINHALREIVGGFIHWRQGTLERVAQKAAIMRRDAT